jgi:hypothetical protein
MVIEVRNVRQISAETSVANVKLGQVSPSAADGSVMPHKLKISFTILSRVLFWVTSALMSPHNRTALSIPG